MRCQDLDLPISLVKLLPVISKLFSALPIRDASHLLRGDIEIY